MSVFVFCRNALTACCVRVCVFDCLQKRRKFFTKLADNVTYMTHTKNKNKNNKVTAVTYEKRKIHIVIFRTTRKQLFSVKKCFDPNIFTFKGNSKTIFRTGKVRQKSVLSTFFKQ